MQFARPFPKSLIADNSWNEGIVLGAPVALYDLGNLGNLEGSLEIDGCAVDRGSGSGGGAVGGPLAAVAWLAEHLAARGRRIKAGDWVMTGSVVRPLSSRSWESCIDSRSGRCQRRI